MRCFLLFVCLLSVAVVPIRSGPVREMTDEDEYFDRLHSSEQKDLIRSALRRIRDRAVSPDQEHDQNDGPEPKRDTEIVLPEEIINLLDKPKHDHDEESFVEELSEWISEVWHLSSQEADELLRTGRSCNGTNGCLFIRRISNFCCPFGK